MRDYRNAKAMAQTLRNDLSEKSITLSHSESLEVVAHMLGLRDWNVLAAKIDVEQGLQPAEPKADEGNAATPRACSFCRRTEYDVGKLIAGPGVFICDRCVGLCSDILIDNDRSYADITRSSLEAKSVEELIQLKAGIERSLATTRRIREAIAPYIQDPASTTEAKLSPHAALFVRKSPEERRAYVSEIELRIGAMERAIAIASELLEETARKSDA